MQISQCHAANQNTSVVPITYKIHFPIANSIIVFQSLLTCLASSVFCNATSPTCHTSHTLLASHTSSTSTSQVILSKFW